MPVQTHSKLHILIIKLIAAGWLASLLLAYPLYFSLDRLYPLNPLSNDISFYLLSLEPVLAPVLAILLIGLLLGVQRREMLLSIILIGAMLIINDRSRLQPWFYQYMLMLAVSAGLRPSRRRSRDEKKTYDCWRIILASIYVWSGVSKFNASFIYEVFPWLIQPAVIHSPELTPFLLIIGVSAPVIETALGLFLLLGAFPRISVVGLVCMHIGILLAIGPLGHNWNQTVWPWNILMATLVILLFWRRPGSLISSLPSICKSPVLALATFLVAIMPVFNQFGIWNPYLSFSLYSGNVLSAYYLVPNGSKSKLPPEFQQLLTPQSNDSSKLDLVQVAIQQFNAPYYPDFSSAKILGQELCEYSEDISTVILDPPQRSTRQRTINYFDCSTIGP